jgi:hypothetical protein
MASYRRLMLSFAAAAAAVSVLSIAAPASAAGFTVGAGEAASAMAAAPDVRHRAAQRIRSAASQDYRRDRYIRPIRNDLDCSWCRRQFVLMIGIGY